MAIKFGNASISKIYLGSNEISKAYLGSNEVFSSGDTTTFITTWRTTTSNETITIPTTGSNYNYNIITSDGQEFTGLTGNHTITFANAGDYDISISGTFPRIYFNNYSDASKLLDIKQFGVVSWGSNFHRSFYGAANLTGTFIDNPNISNATSLSQVFAYCTNFIGDLSSWDVSNVTHLGSCFTKCSSFNSNISSWNVGNVTIFTNMFYDCGSFSQNLSNWDVSSGTNFSGMFLLAGVSSQTVSVQGLDNWDMSSATTISQMFKDNHNFNDDISSWNVGNVTNMNATFFRAYDFDQDLSNWNIINVTDFSNFARNITFSTSNYDAILIGWESTLQGTYPNGSGYTPTISISFGSSKYTSGGAAAAARASLVSNFGWTITDGGSI